MGRTCHICLGNRSHDDGSFTVYVLEKAVQCGLTHEIGDG
jgi:hypothetical protein